MKTQLQEMARGIHREMEQLARKLPVKSKYKFNASWHNFMDVFENQTKHLVDYRRAHPVDTNALIDYLDGMRTNQALTDKERYLRSGYESRGLTGKNAALVWIKDQDGEFLVVFTRDRQALMEIAKFLKFTGIISY